MASSSSRTTCSINGARPVSSGRVDAAEFEAEPLPAGFDELTDDKVAAAARAWWLDDLCERRDAEHDEGFVSFVSYE